MEDGDSKMCGACIQTPIESLGGQEMHSRMNSHLGAFEKTAYEALKVKDK